MRRVSKLLFPAAMMLLLCGFGPCGEVALNNPTSVDDMAHGDGATATDGGSTALIAFFPDIQNDINTLGCGLSACHAPGSLNNPPGFPLVLIQSPTTQADMDANYASFTSFCDLSDPAMSDVILYATGMQVHTGGDIIQVGDPVYNRWVAWIAGGEVKGQ